jgi:signal transduction histidine kinase
VGNAVKYMGDASVRLVTVRASANQSKVRIEVQDTGPGIAPELQQSIFRPYTRAGSTEIPGLGLGLATVQRLTEAMGGAVGVHSNRGKGSLFWVELPQAA